MLSSSFPADVLGICHELTRNNKRAWIVGGSVRDLLSGTPPKDWDIATDARPEEMRRIFRKVIPTGIEHGTVTVLVKGVPYEITTLRGEGSYSDGRRPDSVEFVDDITADLARRDFTVNAIAVDPISHEIIDPFEGQKDLKARVIRAVGHAEDRFAEDGLRVLRAARFAATLVATIDPQTLSAMGSERAHGTFRRVSAERVREELLKTMLARTPSIGFRLIAKTGLLEITFPELAATIGCTQNQWHAYDVWDHTLACVDAMRPDPILRTAALLHDVGKPTTRAHSEKTNDFTFYEHERVGAEISNTILERLRFSNEHRKHIVELVRHHLICYSDDWSDAAVRRWLRRVTPELANDLYELGQADALGKGRDVTAEVQAIDRLRHRVTDLLKAGAALSAKDLAINGSDLMRELGMKPSRALGQVLETLVEAVTDNPEKNTREELLRLARDYLSSQK